MFQKGGKRLYRNDVDHVFIEKVQWKKEMSITHCGEKEVIDGYPEAYVGKQEALYQSSRIPEHAESASTKGCPRKTV
ncbi:hypothetical protein J31TS6_47830 [Brevibacillus reuszeri]|nr:hypothetical protein J31TS6_47830 [Brevibacillus reuszeri]